MLGERPVTHGENLKVYLKHRIVSYFWVRSDAYLGRFDVSKFEAKKVSLKVSWNFQRSQRGCNGTPHWWWRLASKRHKIKEPHQADMPVQGSDYELA